jgi:hypothetical protein
VSGAPEDRVCGAFSPYFTAVATFFASVTQWQRIKALRAQQRMTGVHPGFVLMAMLNLVLAENYVVIIIAITAPRLGPKAWAQSLG